MLTLVGNERGEEREVCLLPPGASIPIELKELDGRVIRVRCRLPDLTLERLEAQVGLQDDHFTLVWTNWLRLIRTRLIILVAFCFTSWLLAICARYLS